MVTLTIEVIFRIFSRCPYMWNPSQAPSMPGNPLVCCNFCSYGYLIDSGIKLDHITYTCMKCVLQGWLFDWLLVALLPVANISRIFRTRTSSTIINIENGLGWYTSGQQFLTATGKRKWWVGTKNWAYCSGIRPLFFRKLQKGSFTCSGRYPLWSMARLSVL